MTTHDRNLLKKTDIPILQAWMSRNQLAWRPGKGDFQLMQVKSKDGWAAICCNAEGVLSTPPELREVIKHFRNGLPYPVATQPKLKASGAQQVQDLRDDIAIGAMQSLLARRFTKDETGRPFVEWVAAMSYEIADAMLEARHSANPTQ